MGGMRRRPVLLTILLAAVVLGRPTQAQEPPRPRPPPPGEICDDPSLVGVPLPPIREEGGCGVAQPVRVLSASGIDLEPPPTVACGVARALSAWLDQAVEPAFAERGAPLAALTVVDAYSCRNRNRAEDAELSEHSFGRAIDISAFRLRDGETVTVLDGWTEPGWSATLRRIHGSACGPFGTVLGPDANPLHADHLHLDVEERGSGAYCR